MQTYVWIHSVSNPDTAWRLRSGMYDTTKPHTNHVKSQMNNHLAHALQLVLVLHVALPLHLRQWDVQPPLERVQQPGQEHTGVDPKKCEWQFDNNWLPVGSPAAPGTCLAASRPWNVFGSLRATWGEVTEVRMSE